MGKQDVEASLVERILSIDGYFVGQPGEKRILTFHTLVQRLHTI